MEGLLSPEDDCSLLLARFREYLEHDDIRYHTMQAATDTVGRVTDRHPEVSRLGRVAGGMGGRWPCPCSGQAFAGAAHILEQRLHAVVVCESPQPGAWDLQLLREARG